MKLIILICTLFVSILGMAQNKKQTTKAKTNSTKIKNEKAKLAKNSINLKALKLKKVDKTKKNTKADLVRVGNKKKSKTQNKEIKESKGANVKNAKGQKYRIPREKSVAIVKRLKKTRATASEIAKVNYLAMKSRKLKSKKIEKLNIEEKTESEEIVKTKPKKVKIIRNKIKSSDEKIKESFNESFQEEKLYFPVDNGEIITGFGVQPCDDITGLKCLNPGITIRGEEGAEVKAAFGGVISNVIEEDENHFTIFILHNDKFMTTYSGLQNINFEKGDVVNRTDVLGEITLDNDTNEPIVEFLLTELLTKNQKNIDPRKYLAK